jgi:Bifunctional DNA primase/polymerase, N-terminal
MAPSNIFAANASKYGTLGWLIFPLAQGAKVPMKGTDGFKSASANRAQHSAWSRAHPDANIAAATGAASGIIVIDLDPRSGSDATLR